MGAAPALRRRPCRGRGAGRRRAARAAGAKRLRADVRRSAPIPTRPRDYARSKAAGERRCATQFPEAGIVRPSIVFGPEDDFFNRFAAMARFSPALPLIGGGKTPLPAGLCRRCRRCAGLRRSRIPPPPARPMSSAVPASTASAPCWSCCCLRSARRRLLVPVPYGLASLQAFFLELPSNLVRLAGAAADPGPGTDAEARQRGRAGALTLDDLGIRPTALELVVPSYLARYRPGGRFVTPANG